ncbi:MAG TPA: sensor histidine kinase [Chitinophagaceae bacterium]|nr:sensor histidine kinase [Chitinophagaceae bacterium]
MEKQAMNIKKRETKGSYVNDIAFRLILVPAFGIIIPLMTGMINSFNFSNWQIKLSFLYTIGIAAVVWQGNRYLHFSMRSYFDWHNKPAQKVLILLLSIAFYTIPVSILLLVGWYNFFGGGLVNWGIVWNATLIILIAVIFITHVYETVFLVKETENEMIRNEQLERTKAEAELEALKNQIDPHFIFNSLNTLSHLIEAKPGKAKLFNDNLAEVYRYILQNKARDLVLLKEEMIFLENYFSLLKIRFDKAVELKVMINDRDMDHYLIPPISLQILVENAIKHNEFSETMPLNIGIELINDEIIIHNRVRKKNLRKPSSRIGLQNLQERYRLTTSKEVIIKEEEKDFTVILPVLKIS